MAPMWRSEVAALAAAVLAIAAIAALCRTLLTGANATTVALLFLLVVLVVAAMSTRRVAVTVSVVAFVSFNYFFLPPLYTFGIDTVDNWVALFTLLTVSVVASHLALEARRRAEEAVTLAQQRHEAEMARRSAESKTALVASLSHDLKTPLTALTIAAENLGSPQLGPEERAEQAQIARAELARLHRLFDNMVELASVHANAVTVEQEWFPPSEIVEGARRQVESRLGAHPIEICDGSGPLLVRIDPRLTSAALAHILENAATYSPDAAPVSITVAVAEGRLRIAVADRGPGLAPQDLGRVFDRFYRGSAGRAERFSSGMGLAITRGLLRLEGGEVSAANRAGGGAVFTLEVPVEARAALDLPGEDA